MASIVFLGEDGGTVTAKDGRMIEFNGQTSVTRVKEVAWTLEDAGCRTQETRVFT